jgi:hypothetical protein
VALTSRDVLLMTAVCGSSTALTILVFGLGIGHKLVQAHTHQCDAVYACLWWCCLCRHAMTYLPSWHARGVQSRHTLSRRCAAPRVSAAGALTLRRRFKRRARTAQVSEALVLVSGQSCTTPHYAPHHAPPPGLLWRCNCTVTHTICSFCSSRTNAQELPENYQRHVSSNMT